MAQDTATPQIDGSGGAYVRFIVLSDARTGSNMLVEALNSHPRIVCFRELFNMHLDDLDYEMPRYRRDSDGDFARFLRERVFCPQGSGVAAVGFKFLYGDIWVAEGLAEALAADNALRVVHLKRRNALRSLVSLKIAEQTGRWMEMPLLSQVRRLTPRNMVQAARHPLRTLEGVRRRMPATTSSAPGSPVTLTYDDCVRHFYRLETSAANFDRLFEGHDALTLHYEDIAAGREPGFEAAQRILGVESQPLAVTLRRQNPQPLRQLIANYDDLRCQFAGPHEAYFDD